MSMPNLTVNPPNQKPSCQMKEVQTFYFLSSSQIPFFSQ